MSIRAVVKNGTIQPVEPLPAEWSEGQEVVIEETEGVDPKVLEKWDREIEEAACRIPAEEHERFLQAIADVERESKEAVRREWGLS